MSGLEGFEVVGEVCCMICICMCMCMCKITGERGDELGVVELDVCLLVPIR